MVSSVNTAALAADLPPSTAVPFIETWHYSKRVPTGKNIFFGWYTSTPGTGDLFGNILYAVADYGIGVNPYQASYLAQHTGQPITAGTLLELKRLCRTDPRIDALPLTAFLARCHRILRQRGYRYIVAYSDPFYGHTGGIYKAANFQHLGATAPEWHLRDSDGALRHRRYAYRYARRNNIPIIEARKLLGLTRVQMPSKDRWFLCID